MINRLSIQQADFWQRLDEQLAWESVSDEAVLATVTGILNRVRQEGDAALIDFTDQFDRLKVAQASALELPSERLQQALKSISPEHRDALTVAAERVRSYAERQKLESWSYTEADGTVLGQQITPLDNVGLYVPGGKRLIPLLY